MIRGRMLVVKIQVDPNSLPMQLNVNYTKQIRQDRGDPSVFW